MVPTLRNAAAFVVLLSSTAACFAADLSAVAVFKDRYAPPECVDLDHLNESASAGVSAVWIWSSDVAPFRSDLSEARRNVRRPTAVWLSVRIEGGADRHLTLRAAPVAMWEEVPEELLPSIVIAVGARGFSVVRMPIDDKAPSRLRLIGSRWGSWWLDVPPGKRSVTITPLAAADRALEIRTEEGETIPRARLSLLDEGAERGDFRKLADYRSDAHGRMLLPGLPDAGPATLLFAAADRAPRVLERTPSLIPSEVTLPRGSRVVGKLIVADGLPVPDAVVTIRTWASDLLPLPLVRVSKSDTQGRWEVGALPQGKAEWDVSAAGFADVTRGVTIDNESVDLGTVTLEPGTTAEVVVNDDRGEPVPSASIVIGARAAAVTDDKGRAWLHVGAKGSVDIRVTAEHCLPATASIDAPTTRPIKVVLRRAFRLTGRFVDAAGTPISDGRARAEEGPRFETKQIQPDGRFDLDLQPDRNIQVELLSPRAAVAKLDVAKGDPGETRDVGDVIAPPGLLVTGRVIRASDGSPVAAARAWLPRPSESGPLMAWAFRDLLETVSGADGSFALTGVPAVPFLLRIEAPSLASVRRAVSPQPGAGSVDLGDIALAGGTTLIVHIDSAHGEDVVARVDTGGSGLSIDMLSAPFSGGKASVANVPSGPVVVSAWRKRDMLCREQITVPAGQSDLEVDCATRRVTVRGSVKIGGHPAGPGTLVWLTPLPPDLPTGIFSFGSGAAQQQHVFSPESPRETAEVGFDGRFEGPHVFPGAWEVLWMSEAGRAIGPRQVVVPDVPVYPLDLEYPGVALDGIVLDSSRRAVKGAEVRDINRRGFAISRDDGSFTLAGPEAGMWHVQARYRGQASAVTDAVVEENTARAFVELILKADEGKVRVSLDTKDGRARGAMVFIETENGRLDLTSADQTGIAAFRLLPPFPQRVRVAASFAGRWAFGDWMEWDEATKGEINLKFGAAGSVVLRSKRAAGLVMVTSANGWRVDRLFQWLGAFLLLQSDGDVAMSGLPPGTYTFGASNQQRIVSVQANKTTEVVFD
ncbi:MAG: carboxypeptidase-like regulatory domain-containing protein [Acidobacteriota bacterium]|nr:carboxypeptidase-like regulatory domain-containing protein [Acidobacteriota bacterium]